MEVYFSGPAVEAHSMSVRDLAPALLGFSDAIDRYKELNYPFLNLDVKITATRAGSFDVVLQLLGTMVSLGQGMNPSDVVQLASALWKSSRFCSHASSRPATSHRTHEVVEQTATRVKLNIGPLNLDVARDAYKASKDGRSLTVSVPPPSQRRWMVTTRCSSSTMIRTAGSLLTLRRPSQ